MSAFRNYLEGGLDEAAGILAGMPKVFIKALVKSWGTGGMGGENSKLELFKKDAKQKDITAAAKLTGGYVAPEDKGGKFARHHTSGELKAAENQKAYAGVALKIDDEWAFMISYDTYATNGGNFKLTAADGSEKAKKRSEQRVSRGRRTYYEFDSKYLKATEIADFIDFDEDKIDVYLVTVDQERITKSAERKGVKDDIAKSIDNTPEKKAAIVKFLDSKSGGIVSAYEDQLNNSVKSITEAVTGMIKSATQGQYNIGDSVDITKQLEDLNTQFKDAKSLAYAISQIVKEGKIKEDTWKGKDSTWAYKTFQELVAKIKKEEN